MTTLRRPGPGASLAAGAVLIAGITVLSRVLGFGRWLTQSATVGYDVVGTAYATANTVPNVLFEVAAGGALAGAIMPLLAAPLARGLRRDVDRIASGVLGWTLAILVPLAILLALLAEPLAQALPGGDTAGGLTADFLRVFAVQIPLYGLGIVLSGVLQAQRRFFWPAFAPVLSSLTVIASYVVYAGVMGAGGDGASGPAGGGQLVDPGRLPAGAFSWLAWGTTAGVAAMSIPLIVPVLRSGVRLRPSLRFPDGIARRARSLALAGVGGLVAQQVAVVSTLVLAQEYGGTGAYPVFQYAQAVYLLPYAVLAVPLATSAFPRLADRAAVADRDGFARLAARTTRVLLLVSGVGAAALAAAAPAVTDVFLVRGTTGDPAVLAGMTTALTLMAPGVAGLALLFHVSRALYALERGRAAVLAASAGWGAVVVLSLLGCVVWIGAGPDPVRTLAVLAAGNGAGLVVGAGVLLGVLGRTAGREALTGVGRTTAVAVASSVAAAALGRTVARALGAGQATSYLPAVAAGLAAALVAGVLVLVGAWLLDRSSARLLLRRGAGPSRGAAAADGPATDDPATEGPIAGGPTTGEPAATDPPIDAALPHPETRIEEGRP